MPPLTKQILLSVMSQLGNDVGGSKLTDTLWIQGYQRSEIRKVFQSVIESGDIQLNKNMRFDINE